MLCVLAVLCMVWARHTLCILGLEGAQVSGELSIMVAGVWHMVPLSMLW